MNRKRFSYVDYDTVYTNEIALLCRKQGEVSFGIADQLNIVIVGRLAIHDSRALRDVEDVVLKCGWLRGNKLAVDAEAENE